MTEVEAVKMWDRQLGRHSARWSVWRLCSERSHGQSSACPTHQLAQSAVLIAKPTRDECNEIVNVRSEKK